MNIKILFPAVTLFLILISCNNGEDLVKKNVFSQTEIQLKGMLESLGDTSLNPRCTNHDGTLRLVLSKDWTSGFFPGCLWMQYEYTQDEFWKEAAQHYTKNISDQQYNGGTHDMGFKMYCSYGAGYRLTNDAEYKEILLQSAKTLATRFNKNVGCIRSWDHHADVWEFPVIIDNMMNLELLFWAAKQTRDSSYYHMAVSHADVTLKNHFRADHSSFHVVNYDTLSGEVLGKQTHQGYAHETAWARGQAWGMYGYTMCYRETGDERYLKQAQRIADFIMDHENLPEDAVPYWDFDAPDIPDAPRDASAAAIICSGLYEMALHLDAEGISYKTFADKIFASLSSPEYLAALHSNNNFILKHSVGNMPANDEIDSPIIYADYYFMEAGLRKMKLEQGSMQAKPVVILKLDDLKYDAEKAVHPRWQQVVDFAGKEKIAITIGIIAESLEKGDDRYLNWIKKHHESGQVEFWNHGYFHKHFELDGQRVSDFKGSGFAYQMEHMSKTQALAREKLNFEFQTFGSPYNALDSNTVKVMENFPEIKVWLYGNSDLIGDLNIMNLKRIPALNMEYPTHKPRFYDLWNNLYFHQHQKYMVLQGHPLSWNAERFNEFKSMITHLKNNNYTFSTAINYYKSQN